MKKIHQYIPLHLSVFLTLGVLIGFYFSMPLSFLAILIPLIALFILLIFYLNHKNITGIRLLQITSYLSIFLIGIASITFQDGFQQKTHYTQHISNENQLVFQIEKKLKPSAFQDKYYAQILQIDSHSCTGKIVVNCNKDSLKNNLKAGEIFLVKTNLSTINKPLNPFTFDYNSYLKKQRIYHQINSKPTALIKHSFEKTTLKTSAGQWQEKIHNSLDNYNFDENERAIINAIVLGQRQSISKELLNSYAGAGAIHILAVSGLHVGILFLILNFLFKPIETIPKGKHIKTVIIIFILWGFALLTGLSGSVVRAVTMFSFIAIGLSLKNQKSPVLHALITSYFFLVLIYPLYLFDVGFQMSYTAVLGIVLLQPKIEKILPRTRWLIPRKIWQLLSVSLAATIGTLPISLFYFHQFPGLFFLSNVVIIPFIGLIMAIGLLVVGLSLIGYLPDILVQIYGAILHTMNIFIEWIASQEQFLFKNISFSLYALLASYLVIVMGYHLWEKRKIAQLVSFLMAIVLLQVVFIHEKYQVENSSELVIFHKTKESIIGVKDGGTLQILHSLDTLKIQKTKFINNYLVGSKITDLALTNKLPNLIQFQDKKILLVDSLGIYTTNSFKPDIVLLSQSPKININRLLQLHRPETVIADGSNYKSYVTNWQASCVKNNIDFYYTGADGAYVLK